jgi:ADP-heptose:LPS heptosyltransferase
MLQTVPAEVKRIGVLSFRDFVSTIARADVFFSGDCGPMHLAAATPPRRGVVTVFTIDKSARYGPLGPNDTAIIDDQTHSAVEEVVMRIAKLLSANPMQSAIRSAVA